MGLFGYSDMDPLKDYAGWRRWIIFVPLFVATAKDCIGAEIAFFKRLPWKTRISIGCLYLAFWGGLLAGAWQIGIGFYEGPNFAAPRIVVVDDIATWRSVGRHNTTYTHWTLEYHFASRNGENLSRRININSDDPPAKQVRDAEVGDEILLRVGVPADEPDAVFGFNKTVRQGLAIVLLLLVLWYFSREGFLDIDAATGKVVLAKGRFIKFLSAFFGVMFGLLWLTSPVIA